MNFLPFSLPERVVQTAAIWIASAMAGILSMDVTLVAPFCLVETRRFGEIGSCMVIVTFVVAFDNLMQAKRDIGPFVAHYWPAPLVATAFTVLILRWWWRRG